MQEQHLHYTPATTTENNPYVGLPSQIYTLLHSGTTPVFTTDGLTEKKNHVARDVTCGIRQVSKFETLWMNKVIL